MSLDKESEEPKTEDTAPSKVTPESTAPAETALQSITASPGVPQNPSPVADEGGAQPKGVQVWRWVLLLLWLGRLCGLLTF